MTPLPQEDLWKTFLVNLIKPSWKVNKSFSTEVSNSVLLESYGSLWWDLDWLSPDWLSPLLEEDLYGVWV